MSGPPVARAYDELAPHYNQQLQEAHWMRHIVRRRALARFTPGARLLDAGCGTGIDALHFADKGFEVVGIDLSPAMIGILRRQAAEDGLSERVEAHVQDFNTLDVGTIGRCEGIYSFFAVLNTTGDLGGFASAAARLLPQDGWLLAHMLGPGSLWSWAAQAFRGRPLAAHRKRQEMERTFPLGSIRVTHSVQPAAVLYERFFAQDFALESVRALSVLRPLRSIRWLPSSLLPPLTRLDAWAGKQQALVNWGDFFLLEMRRRRS